MAEVDATPNVISDPTQELIASLLQGPFLDAWRALPESVSQAEQDERWNRDGLNLYDWMMQDSIFQGALNQLRTNVLSVPVQASLPKEFDGIDPELLPPADVARYAKAVEIRDFVNRSMDSLSWYRSDPMEEVCWNLLEGVIQGHAICEIVLIKDDGGVDVGKEVLHRVKFKPRRNYRVVVDPYNNLAGVMAIQPGKNAALWSGLLGEAYKLKAFVPVEKLCWFKIGGKGDPRGESLLRAAYDAWKRIKVGRPVEVRMMAQFGGGLITVVMGPNAQGGIIDDGATRATPAQYSLAQVKRMESGAGAVFPEGTEIEIHRPTDGGGLVDAYFNRAQKDVVVAILTSARTIMEAERSSKADAGKAENLMDSVVFWLRGKLCSCIGQSIVRLLVERNFGTDVARTLMPSVVMGGARWEDVVNAGANLSALGYTFAPEHLAWIDRRNGLPPRSSAESEDVRGANDAPTADKDSDKPLGD